MAEKTKTRYLICSTFPNPNGRHCKGPLVDVGPEGGKRSDTRLRCKRCNRVVTIPKTKLENILRQGESYGWEFTTGDED